MSFEVTIGIWDYVAIAVCLFLTSFIGIYYSFRKKRSTDLREFLVVNRNMSIWPLMFSAVATHLSASGILGYSAEAYVNGMAFVFWPVGVLLTIPFANYLFIPVFYRLNKTTIYEYLEMRFSTVIKLYASILVGIQLMIFTAIAFYAPALALSQVTGIDLWTIVLIASGVSIVYTALGGFKAVIWTDTCQFVLMVAIVLFILIKGIIKIGGPGVVWSRLITGERADIFIWKENRNTQHTFWTMIIGNTYQRVAKTLLSQPMMQRFLSNRNIEQAKRSYIGVTVGVAVYYWIEISIGLIIFAYYHKCDPLLNDDIKKYDQLLPLFAIDILSFLNGLTGVFIAGLLCASISSVSSNLNSLATIVISNFVTPLKPNLSEKTLMNLSKVLVAVIGVICTALVALIMTTRIVKITFDVFGLGSGPIVLLFTIGMLLPWINLKGATTGLIASMIVPWWSFIGRMITQPPSAHAPYSIEECTNVTMAANQTLILYSKVTTGDYLQQFYSINPLWFPIWSFVIGLTVAAIVSKFTGFQDITQVNPDLFFPFVRNYIIKRQSQSRDGVALQDVKDIPVIKPFLEVDPNDNDNN
ncbi:hypothetical protein CHUAL_008794 [Chamberlinius hualienensis]